MILELKHIVPYLPYGLKAKLSKEGVFNLDSEYRNEYAYSICTITDFTTYSKDLGGSMKVDKTKDYSFDFDSLSEINIILRPLSDLMNIIKIKDKEIIPYYFWDDERRQHDLYLCSTDVGYVEYLEYFIVECLIEWHFDVFGLIEKGLAIDINTLN